MLKIGDLYVEIDHIGIVVDIEEGWYKMMWFKPYACNGHLQFEKEYIAVGIGNDLYCYRKKAKL